MMHINPSARCKPPCENPADGGDGLCSQCRAGVELLGEILAAMIKFGEHRLSPSPGNRYDERADEMNAATLDLIFATCHLVALALPTGQVPVDR